GRERVAERGDHPLRALARPLPPARLHASDRLLLALAELRRGGLPDGDHSRPPGGACQQHRAEPRAARGAARAARLRRSARCVFVARDAAGPRRHRDRARRLDDREPVDPERAEPVRARRAGPPCNDGGVSELTPLRRNRDFLLLQVGQLLSTFGAAMSAIAYPLLALALTGSAAKAGYAGAIQLAPVVLLGPGAGVAAGRFDRRKLMIASDVAGATALAVLAASVLSHHATFWLLLLVGFVDTSAA